MKTIKLSRGEFSIVDDEDFDRVDKFKWHVAISNNGTSKHACRWVNGKRIWLHHFITGLGRNEIDHRDGNGLNNQKSNLRRTTFLKNSKNRGRYLNNTSGFKGVVKRTHGFVAMISIRGKAKYLGFSKDPRDMAKIYDAAAIKNYKEFARTNKMLGLI
jgi:hypothetical protein